MEAELKRQGLIEEEINSIIYQDITTEMKAQNNKPWVENFK